MGCLSSVSFAMLINGPASKFFDHSRELRQGCPLSPLLFLFIIKGHSRIIMEEKRVGAINGVKMGRSLYLTHLLFVDDVLLFSNGTLREACKLQKILV